MLQSSLMRLDISPRRRSDNSPGPGRHGARSRTPQRTWSGHQPTQLQTPGFEFTFDESKFTEDYFRAWDGDIDSDEDFADLVRPPDFDEETASASPVGSSGDGSGEGGGDGGCGTVNLYHAIRERHMNLR